MARFSETDLILKSDGSVYHLNLKPGNISDTIILVGDPGRVHRVSRHFDDVEFEMNQREFITHTGNYKGKKITVMSTGMGSDNLEIVLVELDALFNLDLKKREPKKEMQTLTLIRIGTTASIQGEIKTGDHLVSQYAVGMGTLMSYYDFPQDDFEKKICVKLKEKFNLPFLPYCVNGDAELREKIAFDMSFGNTMTCPGFYAPQGRKIRINTRYPKLIDELLYFHEDDFWFTNFEMETAALYGMSRLLGHKALSISAVLLNRIDNEITGNANKILDGIIKKVLSRIGN